MCEREWWEALYIVLGVGSRHLLVWKHAKLPSGGQDQASRQNSASVAARWGRPTLPPLGAISHRPSLVHCLVGPDVRWSVPGLGWSVWSVWWASFACVTQDEIFCGFFYVFFMISSYSGHVLLKI